MERPGSSLLASIAVHAAVVLAVVGYGLLGFTRAPLDVESAVPVSIVSETVIEAAAADNPDDELVTEDAATAPVAPTPPEPVPPEPLPAPPRPTPAPAPVKKASQGLHTRLVLALPFLQELSRMSFGPRNSLDGEQHHVHYQLYLLQQAMRHPMLPLHLLPLHQLWRLKIQH